MDSITALLLVNIAIWLGVGGYVAFLAKNQQEISKKLNQLADTDTEK